MMNKKMKILIINLGTLTENIVSTSILKGIFRKYKKSEITWCVFEEEHKDVFKYNKKVKNVVTFNELKKVKNVFDLLINLNPYFPHGLCKNIKIKEAIGFGFDRNSNSFVNSLNENKKEIDISLFKMFYILAGLTWGGEGYDISYHPKTKSKKNRAGIAVAHANLRNYVSEELDLESMKIWHIPYKKNIFKKMDQINKCKKIITDDLLTFHLSMILYKDVFFLKTFPLKQKLELFGKGVIYPVPREIYQL